MLMMHLFVQFNGAFSCFLHFAANFYCVQPPDPHVYD